MNMVISKVHDDKIIIDADSVIISGWIKNTKGNFVKFARINMDEYYLWQAQLLYYQN